MIASNSTQWWLKKTLKCHHINIAITLQRVPVTCQIKPWTSSDKAMVITSLVTTSVRFWLCMKGSLLSFPHVLFSSLTSPSFSFTCTVLFIPSSLICKSSKADELVDVHPARQCCGWMMKSALRGLSLPASLHLGISSVEENEWLLWINRARHSSKLAGEPVAYSTGL